MFFQKLKESVQDIDSRKIAPVCLALGLLSLFVASIFLFIQEWKFTEYSIVSGAIGLIFIFLFLFLDPQRVLAWAGTRQARYGANALIGIVALTAILVLANFLVYNQANARKWWVDLTENKALSLAPESINTLKSLTQPIEAKAYFTADYYYLEDSRLLLENFKNESDGKFTYRIIDPTAARVEAVQDGVTQDGTVVIVLGDRQEKISYLSEEQLTSAILRLTFPGNRKVYFLIGHGEGKSTGGDQTDFNKAVSFLTRKNYVVEDLNLLEKKTVPEDAKSIIIAGPVKSLLQTEIDSLREYLNKGGSLIVLQSPSSITELDPSSDLLGKFLTDTYGITFENDVILDKRVSNMLTSFADPRLPTDFSATSKITSGIYMFLMFPSAQSLALNPEPPENLTYTRLIQLGLDPTQVWGETDMSSLESGQTPAFDEAVDNPSPLTVAVAVEDSSTQARLVIVGNADFAANQYFDTYANSDLFINSVDWLSRLEGLVSLTPKTQVSRFIIPPFNEARRLISLTVLFFLPLAFPVAGIIVWLVRRRHK